MLTVQTKLLNTGCPEMKSPKIETANFSLHHNKFTLYIYLMSLLPIWANYHSPPGLLKHLDNNEQSEQIYFIIRSNYSLLNIFVM